MKLLVTTYLTDRNQIPNWLIQNNLKVICEVGVRTGVNLRRLLTSDPSKIYAIDMWRSDVNVSQNDEGFTRSQQENAYQNVKALEKIYPQLKIIRANSIEGAKLIDDRSLDFCYIDYENYPS